MRKIIIKISENNSSVEMVITDYLKKLGIKYKIDEDEREKIIVKSAIDACIDLLKDTKKDLKLS